MAKSRSDGVRGLPKLPTAFKVLFELYCNLDVWSPYCLFTHSVINRQYVLNLRQKARWLRNYIEQLESGCDELAMVEQQCPDPFVGDRELQLRDGGPGVSDAEIELEPKVEQGRVEEASVEEASVAAYENGGGQ